MTVIELMEFGDAGNLRREIGGEIEKNLTRIGFPQKGV
jgi:hypothetical protein